VQRYVLLNKLRIPIVLNQLGNSEEIQLNAASSMDLNFLTENDHSLIRVRLVSRHDIPRVGESFFPVQSARHSDDQWSYVFSTKDIDDFQIFLPKLEDLASYPEFAPADKRPWHNMQEGQFARVTIVNDTTDNGKLFIIISTPR
jgi:hypothetical protein